MNRRDFFIASGIIGSSCFIKKLRAFNYKGDINYLTNLYILTDNSELAIKSLQPYIPILFNSKINISETTLFGTMVGDIVAITRSGLFNYKIERNNIAEILFDLSSKLKIPRTITNPYFISISNNFNIKPNIISLYSESKIIETFPINEEIQSYKIINNFGELYLNISDQSVWVNGSSCKHKNCEHHGKIRNAGENIICLPNRIRIVINGKKNFDLQTY